jgi:hypothetical protein
MKVTHPDSSIAVVWDVMSVLGPLWLLWLVVLLVIKMDVPRIIGAVVFHMNSEENVLDIVLANITCDATIVETSIDNFLPANSIHVETIEDDKCREASKIVLLPTASLKQQAV